MTVEEIFSHLCAHMKKGTEIHNKIAEAFGFLNLYGYQKCHEYHYYEENYHYNCLKKFYLNNYNKILPKEKYEELEIYPAVWYKYTQQDVDTKTKRESIQMLFKKWITWEQEAKQLIENSYQQLLELKEIFSAQSLIPYILDVGIELEEAKKLLIDLESISYDLSIIIPEQNLIYKKYIKKIKKIYEDDE